MICLTCTDDDDLRFIHIYSDSLTISSIHHPDITPLSRCCLYKSSSMVTSLVIAACGLLSVFATTLYLVNHACFIITHLYTMPSMPQLNSHEIFISICRSLCRALVDFKEFSPRDWAIKIRIIFVGSRKAEPTV